ncbi:MAG: glycoside hydrolase family 3 C-terminal domain-containing protein [Lewinellaceae bacterium]|nr:glycoside hydrolase family 3 C-terminal domain-containing protein [Lewinellaceae bacterium]
MILSNRTLPTLLVSSLAIFITACAPQWTETDHGTYKVITNNGGATLGYAPQSGITILTVSRHAFKDLNRNGSLDPYEDWRLSADLRAADLAKKMTVEQIAGLMLYSAHQRIPGGGFRGDGTYQGKPYDQSGAKASDLSDQQIEFLKDDNLRHVLVTTVESPAVAAEWNNNVQALVEGLGLGIPANNSSDPRHGTVANAEYNLGSGGAISMWPGSLGLAATFDPDVVQQFGTIASKEYRALGIATALSPQIDLATEPRWNRVNGTFGEHPGLATDMARAYVDGFQTSDNGGWGFQSVNAMVKHWPSGGPEEGGRDGHFGYGKFAVYPGNNLKDQLKPFVDGAFHLNGGTGMASAVMPYYTISYQQDTVYGENVGNSYSKYIIQDLLRGTYGYDGVVCTDWMITADPGTPDQFLGKCWGMETASVAERHFKVLEAGVDQFGGNNDAEPVMAAYQMLVDQYGEQPARDRFETSAIRLLKNIFRTGLFENPYLDPEESTKTVGQPDYMLAGYEAQLKSIVMVKNTNQVLPVAKKKTVFVPKRLFPATVGWFGNVTPERTDYPVNMDMIRKYYEVTDDPQKADVALVFIKSPASGTGYDKTDLSNGGNGYVPISLQYSPYTAGLARDPSMAGGDPSESFTNRTYQGKSIKTSNQADLKLVADTKKAMGDKPVIVCLDASNPTVMEFEPYADAVLVSFSVQDQALLDLISGDHEPGGLLPMQMPANMQTVETQKEDVPLDMEPYKDSAGHVYNFGYGLNWQGVISDQRTAKYVGANQ